MERIGVERVAAPLCCLSLEIDVSLHEKAFLDGFAQSGLNSRFGLRPGNRLLVGALLDNTPVTAVIKRNTPPAATARKVTHPTGTNHFQLRPNQFPG